MSSTGSGFKPSSWRSRQWFKELAVLVPSEPCKPACSSSKRVLTDLSLDNRCFNEQGYSDTKQCLSGFVPRPHCGLSFSGLEMEAWQALEGVPVMPEFTILFFVCKKKFPEE